MTLFMRHQRTKNNLSQSVSNSCGLVHHLMNDIQIRLEENVQWKGGHLRNTMLKTWEHFKGKNKYHCVWFNMLYWICSQTKTEEPQVSQQPKHIQLLPMSLVGRKMLFWHLSIIIIYNSVMVRFTVLACFTYDTHMDANHILKRSPCVNVISGHITNSVSFYTHSVDLQILSTTSEIWWYEMDLLLCTVHLYISPFNTICSYLFLWFLYLIPFLCL